MTYCKKNFLANWCLRYYFFIISKQYYSVCFSRTWYEEILFEGTSEELHFNSVENDNFIISAVTDAEGNQITEVKINKLTNQLEIDGINLSKEEQIELNNYVEYVNNEYISDSEYFVSAENEVPIIEMASANACKYKSLGTYYGSSAVPKIGVFSICSISIYYYESSLQFSFSSCKCCCWRCSKYILLFEWCSMPSW